MLRRPALLVLLKCKLLHSMGVITHLLTTKARYPISDIYNALFVLPSAVRMTNSATLSDLTRKRRRE